MHRAHIERCQAWQRTLLDHGWACITWPAEYGGRGGTAMEATIFAEEQARYGVANDVFAVAIGMVGPTIIAHGTPEQQERYLTPLLRGDELWCQLFSEPGAGSDLAGIATRAVRDGDEFVVDGPEGVDVGRRHGRPGHPPRPHRPVGAQAPGHHVLPGRHDDAGHRDPAAPPDDRRHPLRRGLPRRGAHPGGERARRGRRRLGRRHDHPAQRAGVHRRQRAALLPRRPGRSSPATTTASTTTSCARASPPTHIRSEILTYLGYRVRTAVGRGEEPGPEASCIKLAMAGHLRTSFDLALAIQGAAGAVDGDRWHQQFLNAPSIRIAGGSDEIQRNVIAERALGLPARTPGRQGRAVRPDPHRRQPLNETRPR